MHPPIQFVLVLFLRTNTNIPLKNMFVNWCRKIISFFPALHYPLFSTILKKPKNVCNTEFKVMPGKSSKLCLMDPIILSWIVSLIAVIIYIIGIKYKPKDI